MIGGSYKNSDNEIAEELADGTRRVSSGMGNSGLQPFKARPCA